MERYGRTGRTMRALWKSGARLALLTLAVGTASLCALPTAGAGRGGPRCPVKALDEADGPVKITFWYAHQAKNEETLLKLIEKFEASQDRVRVNLVNVPTYPDMFEKYRAGLSTGDLPDLVQMDESSVQALVDSQSTIPIESCVKADNY